MTRHGRGFAVIRASLFSPGGRIVLLVRAFRVYYKPLDLAIEFLAVIQVEAFQELEFYPLDFRFGQRVEVIASEITVHQ